MSKASTYLRKLQEDASLAEIGDRVDAIANALKRAGILVVSVYKGDAASNPEFTLDNGNVITMCKDSGELSLFADKNYQQRLHPKQRMFQAQDVINILKAV